MALFYTPSEVESHYEALRSYVMQFDQEVLAAQASLPPDFVASWSAFARQTLAWVNNTASILWMDDYDQATAYLTQAADFRKQFEALGGKSYLPANPQSDGQTPIDWNQIATYGLIGLGLIVLIQALGLAKEVA